VSFLLPGLVALLPLLITPGLLFHYDSLPKIALLAFAMAVALLRPMRAGQDIRALWQRKSGKWLCIVAGAQVLWTAMATAASSRPWFSLLGSNWRRMGLATIVALALFAVLSAAWLSRKPELMRLTLRAFAVAAICVSFYAIAQYFGFDPWQNAAGYHAKDGDFTIVRPPSTMGHADYLGWWLSIVLFCTWGLRRIEQGLWREVALLATILSGIAILFSGTRSAISAAGFGLLFLVYNGSVRPRRRHLLAALAIAGALVIFYESPGGTGLRARVQWSADETAGGARPLLWRDSLRMASSSLLLGFGPETFSSAFPQYQSEELARRAPEFYHESPHNAALDALTGEGIPGLLVALGWVAVGVYAIRLGRKSSPLHAALTAALVASIAASLFNAMTIAPAMATLTVIAMLVALQSDREPAVAPRPIVSRFAVAAAFPIAVGLAAFGIFLTAFDFRLEQFSRTAAGSHGELAVAAYNTMRQSELDGPSEDLYCSRRLADSCGAGFLVIARFECARVATQAAARATVTADNPPNAFYNLAMFAAAMNDARGTEKELRQAASLAPNWFQPHWALANLLDRSGRHADAVAEIQRAVFLTAGRNSEVTEASRRIERSQ
jgi:O-antigen ligase